MEVHHACASLGNNGEVSPYHEVDDVTASDKLDLGGAVDVHLLFLAEIDSGAFS